MKKYQIKNNCDKYNFDQNENGQSDFCKTCSKRVTDLTSLNNLELNSEIIKYNNTCVRIKPRQISIVNSFINQKSKIGALALAATMLSSSCNRKAALKSNEIENGRLIINEIEGAKKKQNIISGILLDGDDNEALIGGSIYIPNSELGVATDIDGKFTLPIPDEFIKDGKIEIHYPGFQKVVIPIKDIIGKDIRIYLTEGITLGYIELIE